MPTIVGIRFRKACKIYYFDPVETGVKKGDYAIVETARGVEYGEVVLGPREVESTSNPLKPVIRKAEEEDAAKVAQNAVREQEAFHICERRIKAHELPMNLVDVEFTYDVNKIIFYFTADGRIDFRDLVKDLAGIFRTRIELHQIGVRDEAKMLGGIGCCGRPLCCATFLGDFEPVSIKMAKNQNLSLNPTKISGICGRLMCCLKYEDYLYSKGGKRQAQKDDAPKLGSIVACTLGEGKVVRVLRQDRQAAIQLTPDNIVTVNWDEIVDPSEAKEDKSIVAVPAVCPGCPRCEKEHAVEEKAGTGSGLEKEHVSGSRENGGQENGGRERNSRRERRGRNNGEPRTNGEQGEGRSDNRDRGQGDNHEHRERRKNRNRPNGETAGEGNNNKRHQEQNNSGKDQINGEHRSRRDRNNRRPRNQEQQNVPAHNHEATVMFSLPPEELQVAAEQHTAKVETQPVEAPVREAQAPVEKTIPAFIDKVTPAEKTASVSVEKEIPVVIVTPAPEKTGAPQDGTNLVAVQLDQPSAPAPQAAPAVESVTAPDNAPVGSNQQGRQATPVYPHHTSVNKERDSRRPHHGGYRNPWGTPERVNPETKKEPKP